jgi:D-alanyl-D-alanine carboxypeptidase
MGLHLSRVFHSGPALPLFIAILMFVTACTSPQAETHMGPTPQLLNDLVEAGKTPSVQYRFVGPDSIIFRHDAGMADLARGVRVSSATAYNGFSITKTFTAAAILQLAERGDLELDRPAAAYLPDFPYSREITVRHLLAHSAGIPNPIPLSWIHLREEHASFDRDAFFRSIFERHSKAKGKPNTRFSYSNLGYVLLGQIVEHVSDRSYEQYITENILEPLGLSAEYLGFVLQDSRQATGYHRRNSFSYVLLGLFLSKSKYMEPAANGWRAFRPYYLNGAAYGGLIGTADGFARYVQALLDPESGLLSEESRHLLFSENILDGGKSSGVSLSWFRGELDHDVYYAHAGGGGGYYAEVRIYPELQRGSVILFNRTGMSDERFLDRVDRHLIRAGAGL